MKNRKLYQLFIASVVSAAMMTSGVSVGAADFSDDAAVAAEQSVTSEEDAAPVVDAGSDFSCCRYIPAYPGVHPDDWALRW